MDTGTGELRRLAGFLGYWITSEGRVFSGIEQVTRGGSGNGWRVIVREEPIREIHPTLTGRYLVVGLYRDKKAQMYRVHVLVLITFSAPRPFQGAVSRHLNGNSTDNRIDNLRWGTQRENIQDKIDTGTIAKGTHHGMAKVNEEVVQAIRSGDGKRGWLHECKLRYGLSQSQVSRIWHHQSWRDVE